MPDVNPEILRWARETAGLDPETASKKIQLGAAKGVPPVKRLAALESGEETPSRAMLSTMAGQYHRPLLIFYLSAPPLRGDRGEYFRTLPTGRSDADDALLDALLRDIRARQSMIRSVLEEEDEATPLPFIGLMGTEEGVSSVASSICTTLKFSVDEFRACSSPQKAFALLRSMVEDIGVFVILKSDLGSHHTKIDLQTFRGFALADPVAPFVVINGQDAKTARSFTLLHELTHLWLGKTGVSGERSELAIERFSNDVASEILLPTQDLKTFSLNSRINLETLSVQINSFATARNLSSSMVAYKLFRISAIERNTWENLNVHFKGMWHEERLRQRDKNRKANGGPDANVVESQRLGDGLLGLMGRMLHAGAITTSKAGKVLGVKGKRVQTLLNARGHGGIQ